MSNLTVEVPQDIVNFSLGRKPNSDMVLLRIYSENEEGENVVNVGNYFTNETELIDLCRWVHEYITPLNFIDSE